MKYFENLNGEVIYKNNHVANIYEACTCCYDNTKSIGYLEKKKYIEKRVNAGHESILEHGRMALKISNITDPSYITDVITYEYSRYLEFYTVHKEDDTYVLIVNGNIRAYKFFFTNTTENDYENNPITRTIHSLIVSNTVGELYGNKFVLYITKPTFIDIETFKNESSKYDKLLEPSTGIQYDTLILNKTINIQTTDRTKPIKKVDIGIDTDYIQDLIDDCDISPEVFFNIIPVTIVFKNMSRTATHQLVRHRNAITQESQRYVNAKNATFTIPVPDYDDSTKYNITLFGQKKEVDLFELANELLSVYTQLTDAGLKKEEARAYLPSNVNCGRLYMTFSLYNLVSFLKLRTDNHAQYEIRKYAEAIKEALTITLSLFGIVLNLELNT
jgi:flavin-dependent thymidylate synthase